jgi:hypothetical protein
MRFLKRINRIAGLQKSNRFFNKFSPIHEAAKHRDFQGLRRAAFVRCGNSSMLRLHSYSG